MMWWDELGQVPFLLNLEMGVRIFSVSVLACVLNRDDLTNRSVKNEPFLFMDWEQRELVCREIIECG
jgi:hypothetical protein